MGTICADNPRLNARLDQAVVQPCRVVVDSAGRLRPDALLFTVEGPVLVVTNGANDQTQHYFDSRTEQIHLPDSSGKIDLEGLLLELGRRGCNDVLVEAGATLVGEFVTRNLVDEYLIYLSPDILGTKSRGMFDASDITKLDEKIELEIIATKQLGVLEEGDHVVVKGGDVGARFLLVAARPLNEPIARYGPFVMNTKIEIEEAINDFSSGFF